MLLDSDVRLPLQYERILTASSDLGFVMNSDVLTGSLLRSLVASRPGGRVLELGTGCGLGTCWILDGLSPDACVVSIDTDAAAQAVARRELGDDRRVEFVLGDGGEYLNATNATFDVIYADAWPGKYSHLDRALSLVAPGGIYLIDDMLPQPNWPADHPSKVAALLERLERLEGFAVTFMSWSTGLVLCVRRR
jgi:predicted O-methyltransferase YrrM